MILETEIPLLFKSIFNNRLYWDTAPESMGVADMQNPFCIVQQAGGEDLLYVDNTPHEFLNARLQFFVWGANRIAVSNAMALLRKEIIESNTAIFVTRPLGAPVNDHNDVLKLRGRRQDFGFWYPDPLYVE